MLSSWAARVTRIRHVTPAMAAATAVLLFAGLLAAVGHDDGRDSNLATDRTTTTTAASDLDNDDTVDPATDTSLAPVVAGPTTTTTAAGATSTTTTAAPAPVCKGAASTVDEAGLWIVDAADGRLQRVIAEGVETFAWSPDGKHLAYTAGPREDRRLVVLDIPGASRTVYDDLPVRALAWTADSAKVVMAVRADEDRDRIVVAPTTGGDATDLHDAGEAIGDLEVRPDGSVVFTDGGTLAVIDADGSDRRNLITATGSRAVLAIAVSPDGKQVAYTDGTKFGVVTIEGGAVKELGNSEPRGRPLAWSSDSKRVAFVPVQGDREVGVAARPDGTELRTVGAGGAGFALAPSGREMAWESSPTLTAADLTTGKERVVGRDMWQPTWAPDSGSMAVYAKVAGEARPALCLVGVGSRRVAQLKGTAAPVSALAWSPSGATVAFSTVA